MDFSRDPHEEAFRQEVRSFIAESLPPELAARTRLDFRPRREDMQAWNAILYRKGWSAPAWPKEYGGTGWSPVERHIFADECAAADAPPLSVFGLQLAGPTIYTYGSDGLKSRHLPGILSGEVFWCQGFSEPDAGSDLASLRTRAVRDGEDWMIAGRKIWTTQAHFADMMFCLARTDPDVKPQRGLSFFLLDMKAPGVSVRPIITLDRAHEVNEVALDNVRVPGDDLVGEANRGWDYAKFLLTHERTFSANVPKSRRALKRLKAIAERERKDGRPLAGDPSLRRRIAEAEIELDALEFAVYRALGDKSGTSAVSAILKLRGSELEQKVTSLIIEALGTRALRHWQDPSAEDALSNVILDPDDEPGAMGTHLFLRAATIYSGSNEIQRNIIAKQLLDPNAATGRPRN
jgi:alkylation response protein AidB-like acyl-CoA dehydrogenase